MDRKFCGRLDFAYCKTLRDAEFQKCSSADMDCFKRPVQTVGSDWLAILNLGRGFARLTLFLAFLGKRYKSRRSAETPPPGS